MQRSRFRSGWDMANRSWQLLRENKSWIRYPLNSSLVLIGVTIVFGILFLLFGNTTKVDQDGTSRTVNAAGIVLLFLFYLVSYTVATYTEVALARMVIGKLREETLPENAGYETANKKIGPIVGYAAISATVGLISQLIRDSARDSKNIVMQIVASILASLLQAAWSIASYFVVPILATEEVGTIAAVERSFALIKKTWGEQIISNFSLGFFGCGLMLLGTLPGILVTLIGSAISAPFITVVGIGALVLGIAIINLFLNAVNTILKVVLYNYALTGEAMGQFDVNELRGAFTPKGARA